MAIKIQYVIDDLPDKEDWLSFPYFPEATIQVLIGDKLYYKDSEFFIAELGLSLQTWFRKVKKEGAKDYAFLSADYEEGPTLAFQYNGNGGYYISSLFQEYEHKDPVDEQELLEGVEKFLSTLSMELEYKYGIILEEYED